MLKVRRAFIGSSERLPVQVAPIAVLAHVELADRCTRIGFLHGERERQRSLRGQNDAAIAISLLDVVLPMFQQHLPMAHHGGKPVDGGQVGSGEADGGVHKGWG